MANADRPGFYPVGTVSGAPWQGSVKLMKCDTNAENLFVGDVVKLEADGYINAVAAGEVMVGTIVNKLPVTPPNPQDTLALSGNTEVALGQQYSSQADTFLVCTAPDVILECECVGASIEQANIGETVNVSVGAGNTTTGISGMRLAAPAGVVAATSQFKVWELGTKPDNDLSAANAKLYVVPNMHILKTASAGI